MSTPNAPLARAVHGLIAGSVATHEAVAERLGINSTDLRCLVLASTETGLQPTRLAELAGLTTGAITGVLDRLERAGFVRREPDPADRRRLRVRVVADRVDEIEGYHEPPSRASAEADRDLGADRTRPRRGVRRGVRRSAARGGWRGCASRPEVGSSATCTRRRSVTWSALASCSRQERRGWRSRRRARPAGPRR